MNESTFVIIKPDGVNYFDEIVSKLHFSGMKISKAVKINKPEHTVVREFFKKDGEWAQQVGQRIAKVFEAKKLDVLDSYDSFSYTEVGRCILARVVQDFCSNSIIIMQVEGIKAANKVARLCGLDICPSKSEKDSIRNLYADDDIETASIEQRPVRNLVHYSAEECVKQESEMWFKYADKCPNATVLIGEFEEKITS